MVVNGIWFGVMTPVTHSELLKTEWEVDGNTLQVGFHARASRLTPLTYFNQSIMFIFYVTVLSNQNNSSSLVNLLYGVHEP